MYYLDGSLYKKCIIWMGGYIRNVLLFIVQSPKAVFLDAALVSVLQIHVVSLLQMHSM